MSFSQIYCHQTRLLHSRGCNLPSLVITIWRRGVDDPQFRRSWAAKTCHQGQSPFGPPVGLLLVTLRTDRIGLVSPSSSSSVYCFTHILCLSIDGVWVHVCSSTLASSGSAASTSASFAIDDGPLSCPGLALNQSSQQTNKTRTRRKKVWSKKMVHVFFWLNYARRTKRCYERATAFGGFNIVSSKSVRILGIILQNETLGK